MKLRSLGHANEALRFGCAALLALAMTGAGAAYAQGFPAKPIRIATSAAGGGNDISARQIAQGITGPLGQPVIVDNRTALQASEAVSKAPPDGYMLLYMGGTLWISPFMQKAPYDVSDFSPVTLTMRSVNILVVHPSLPVNSVKELIALAKARPGALNYGSASIGSSLHLAGLMFGLMAGVNIVHVPYKATAIAVNDLMSGELQLMFSSIGPAMGHVKTGRLKALAGTSVEPSALLPGMPTVAGSGLPGYESVAVEVVMAPAQTPAPVITRLNQEIVRFVQRADVKEKFLNIGSEVVGSSPSELGATIKSDMAKWGKLIKDANIRVD